MKRSSRIEEHLPEDVVSRLDAEVLAGVTDRADLRLGDRLCLAAARVLPVDAAAVSVFLGSDVCIPVGASDDEAALAERVHFTSGEGPCLQAYLSGRSVVMTNLRDPESEACSVWPVYVVQMSRRTSYNAVAAFPMMVIGSVLGVFSLFRSRVEQELDLEVVAVVVAWTIRQLMGGDTVLPNIQEPALSWLDTPVARRRTLWRAQGIVMRANGLDPRQALNLMRAWALASHRLVDEVAEDVVRGHLR